MIIWVLFNDALNTFYLRLYGFYLTFYLQLYGRILFNDTFYLQLYGRKGFI